MLRRTLGHQGIAMLFALMSLCAGAQTPPNRVYGTVPYTILSGPPTPVVQLLVNGHVNGNFLIDTGATQPLISSSMVRELALPTRPAMDTAGKPISLLGKPAEEVTLTTVNFGGLAFNNINSLVYDGDRISQIAGTQIDGVICANLLKSCSMLIDPDAQTVTVCYPGELTDKDITAFGMTGVPAIPARYDTASHKVKITARLNDTLDLDLAIDTGAGISHISTAAANQLKLRTTDRDIEYHTPYGAISTNRARVETLALGSTVWYNIAVAYAKKTNSRFFPLIGGDILRGSAILFDLPDGKLYIKHTGRSAAEPHTL